MPETWREEHISTAESQFKPLFSEQGRATVLGMSPVSVPRFATGSLQKQRQALEKGQLIVVHGESQPDLDKVEWSATEHGLYYSTQLHAMAGIASLLNSTVRLDEAKEQKIADLITNWALCAAHNPEINDRAWYEGTVVKRQSTFLRALSYVRVHGGLGDLAYEDLIYLIDLNAEYLLDTPKIYSFGNHGIRQDMLLAATALHLPDHPRAEEMLNLAETRLNEAANTLFSDEGIWLEHAPGYVNYALRLMLDVEALAQQSEDFRPDYFLERINTSSEYLLDILTPGIKIPWIGSSKAGEVTSTIRTMLEERLGKSIEELVADRSRTVKYFPSYGHAIVRGDHPEGLYLLFNAAQNLPAGKRHADDLSFLIFNRERNWITEGSHQSYERSGMSHYLRSPFAHNVYVRGNRFVRGQRRA